jgi:hypothetical protein
MLKKTFKKKINIFCLKIESLTPLSGGIQLVLERGWRGPVGGQSDCLDLQIKYLTDESRLKV